MKRIRITIMCWVRQVNLLTLPEVPNQSQGLHPAEANPICKGNDYLCEINSQLVVTSVNMPLGPIKTYKRDPNHCVGFSQETCGANRVHSLPQLEPRDEDYRHSCIAWCHWLDDTRR
jgi:hypothetical protein